MDQEKIGIFISQCRRAKGWTQSRLAEELGITDKAVSKWETGRSMPDLSLFMPLCGLLGISLNELMAGEAIPDERLKEKSEEVLMEVITTYLGRDKQDDREHYGVGDTILKLQDVSRIYQTENTTTTAVNHVTFQVSRGSFVGIMGASGSGKTTLLNMIATIDRPTGGRIEIDGQNVAEISEESLARFRRDHLGFVFQEYNLLETMSIQENIALALTIRETPKNEILEIIQNLAVKLGIKDVLSKFPYEVSGGQRQRCACARAIASNPGLILADEPTGALDSHSARQLLDTLVMLRKEYGATILMVTHDAMSASYCDRILFLQDGEIRSVLERKQQTKQAFFTSILEGIAQLEGEDGYVS